MDITKKELRSLIHELQYNDMKEFNRTICITLPDSKDTYVGKDMKQIDKFLRQSATHTNRLILTFP